MDTNKHSNNLVVDLDGSLIKTDLLLETFIKAIYSKPWLVFLIPFWLIKGKTVLKKQLAQATQIDATSLPYNQPLVKYLEEQHAEGRCIILCTGSWHSLAQQVAAHFPFITHVYGSDEKTNLTGTQKATFLTKKYGENNFSYVGNEDKDLKIWKHSDSAIVVSNNTSLKVKTEGLCKIEQSFSTGKASLKAVIKQIRAHQWVKNFLIFIPLITSHQITNSSLFLSAMIAFIAFSLCASATYILNDLADLESDRKHPKKQFRPMASGDISIIALAISLFLHPWFLLSLGIYIVITLSYSFRLKKLQSIDITILASLYTLRIIAGAIAINVTPSFWLLAFSMFVFLCLAIIKRLSEILKNKERYDETTKLDGRGYFISDFHVLLNLAAASGMMSILIFAMYINSPEVAALYSTPYALWLICPLFGYWILRVIIMASRGEIDEDPIVFAIKDRRSWVTGFIILVIIAASSF